MRLMDMLRPTLDRLLASLGLAVVERDSLYDWQRGASPRAKPAGEVPAATDGWLRGDNPELLALQQRYPKCDPAVITPLAGRDDVVSESDLRQFRGHNAYVWQMVGHSVRHNLNPLGHLVAYYYLQSIDHLGLLDRCTEDGAFGANTFEIGGRLISRDLLDAVSEIYFLERHLGLSRRKGFRILDIGAGYGRLGHRMMQALPNITEYTCTDAFPLSTFLSAYYLRHRGVQDRTKVVPLDEIQNIVPGTMDLAVNVHSFSECRTAAIAWWLALSKRALVRHLMIVPNATDDSGTRLLTNYGHDMRPLVEAQGYRLVVSAPKYGDPMVQRYAICRSTTFSSS